MKIQLGEFSPDEVLPFITREKTIREYRVNGKTYLVRMNSQRYFVFRESLQCVVCGLVGSKMILEQRPSDESPHFNLYAEENGKLVMMTKDHVRPKVFGGEDKHSNYQSMCQICNSLKGSAYLTVESIRELRKIYNENKDKLNRKQLQKLLVDVKNKVPRKEERIAANKRYTYLAAQKAKESYVVTCCDLNILKVGDNLIGKSVYEQAKGEQIACINQGAKLKPIGYQDSKVIVKFDAYEIAISQCLLDYEENYVELGQI